MLHGLAEFVREAGTKSPEELERLHGHPFLIQRDHFPLHEMADDPMESKRTDPVDMKAVREAMQAIDPDSAIWVVELVEPEITIGRSPRSMLFIPHPKVSGRHASLVRTDAGYHIIDHGSTNGTSVGGKRIAPETPHILRQGDIVAIADLRFQYFDPDKFLATVRKMIQKLGGHAA